MAVIALVVLALVAWRFDLFAVRSGTPFSSVEAAFDPPPTYPGYTWTRNGRTVSPFELVSAAGPEHCGWQSATFLTLRWPAGTIAAASGPARLYIRDPNGSVSASYRDRLVLHATLPSDAQPTGHRHGSIEIYLSPSDQDEAIYVVAPSGAERWPRSELMGLCA